MEVRHLSSAQWVFLPRFHKDKENMSSNTMVLSTEKVIVVIRISCNTIPHQDGNDPIRGTIDI